MTADCLTISTARGTADCLTNSASNCLTNCITPRYTICYIYLYPAGGGGSFCGGSYSCTQLTFGMNSYTAPLRQCRLLAGKVADTLKSALTVLPHLVGRNRTLYAACAHNNQNPYTYILTETRATRGL